MNAWDGRYFNKERVDIRGENPNIRKAEHFALIIIMIQLSGDFWAASDICLFAFLKANIKLQVHWWKISKFSKKK